MQHYVPRFLLKGFGRGKKSHLWVFDKRTGRTFRTRPGKVAAASGFYDLSYEEGQLTLEPALADLESAAATVIHRIRRARSVQGLELEDKALLSLFMAVQHLRTPHFREQVRHMDQALQQFLGSDVDTVENYRPFSEDEEIKAFAMRMIQGSAPELAGPILDKVWILVETERRRPFWASDHPLTFHNERDFGPRGNIGLAVPGIEIYLPLSDTLTLLLSCPTNFEHMDAAVARAERLREALGERGEAARRTLHEVTPLIRAVREGRTLPSQPENVTFQNSLQVCSAERWLFSPLRNFDLAEDMIGENPRLKEGPRIEIA